MLVPLGAAAASRLLPLLLARGILLYSSVANRCASGVSGKPSPARFWKSCWGDEAEDAETWIKSIMLDSDIPKKEMAWSPIHLLSSDILASVLVAFSSVLDRHLLAWLAALKHSCSARDAHLMNNFRSRSLGHNSFFPPNSHFLSGSACSTVYRSVLPALPLLIYAADEWEYVAENARNTS